MIIAWFMRYGSLTMNVFSELDELAETLVTLEDAESCVFDQWGCFTYAEDAATGHRFTQEEIDAAEEDVRQVLKAEADAYEAPAYTHSVSVRDDRGRWHHYRSFVGEAEAAECCLERMSGLGDRVRVKAL